MKKKLLVILPIIAMLCLTACTDTTVAPQTENTEATIETTTAFEELTETPTEITTEAPTASHSDINIDNISVFDWSGEPYVEVNNNEPYFTKSDYTTSSFETYSELDSLGRCGVAFACIGTDTMPTEERGNIGSIKPSGWHTSNYNEYPGLVDGNYLYNRCHLIAFMLAGENANEKNLITGTRYMNVTGMLPFEDKVHDYMIANPDNHVLYRVTPIFKDNNLVADGVLMEAYSIEDLGALSFCVFCYNVQPYITIDYSTGDNHIADNYIHSENTETTTESWEDNPNWYSYVLNENSKKIHRPDCSAVADMNEENKTETNRSYDELISEGYTPCKLCNPN